MDKSFVNDFNSSETAFTRVQNFFELNLFLEKLLSRLSNTADKIVLTACQFPGAGSPC